MFITDMNRRERTSYAAQMRLLADSAEKAAVALETENDEDLSMHVLMLTFSMMGSLKPLLDILKDAAVVDTSDLDKPLPPEPE